MSHIIMYVYCLGLCRLFAGIADSNTAGGKEVCLLCLYTVLSCVGRGLLRRTDPSSQAVLPRV
jgi:hypothetical protein